MKAEKSYGNYTTLMAITKINLMIVPPPLANDDLFFACSKLFHYFRRRVLLLDSSFIVERLKNNMSHYEMLKLLPKLLLLFSSLDGCNKSGTVHQAFKSQ